MQTAMQDLRDDLLESIFKVNNRLDFLDNITDENVRNICKVMVDTTLKGIVKRIDDELLEMEKQQIIDAYDQDLYGGLSKDRIFDNGENYYNETYGGKDIEKSEKPINLTSSQTEISDEEIFKGILKHCSIPHDRILAEVNAIIEGAEWYREQLKSKI